MERQTSRFDTDSGPRRGLYGIRFYRIQKPARNWMLPYTSMISTCTQAAEMQQAKDIINDIDMSDTFSVTPANSLDEAMQRMDEGLTRAVVVIELGNDNIESVSVTIDTTDPTISYAVASELPVFFEEYSISMSIQSLNNLGFSNEQSEKAAFSLYNDIRDQ